MAFALRPAVSSDVDPAVTAIVAAFASDPLIDYFFPGSTGTGARQQFFSLLLHARIALAMPAFVLQQDGDVLGLAMGYDTSRPTWPQSLADAWTELETTTPGLAARFAAYDEISARHQPAAPHHYLGVIGVRPSLQRRGAGAALLDAFCATSDADPRSSGVYLETSNAASLRFYLGRGFTLLGEGQLASVPLWCVFRPT